MGTLKIPKTHCDVVSKSIELIVSRSLKKDDRGHLEMKVVLVFTHELGHENWQLLADEEGTHLRSLQVTPEHLNMDSTPEQES
jgi:hypothetical protein